MSSRARFQKRSTTSRAGASHANQTLGLSCRAVLSVIVAMDGATIAEIGRELAAQNSSVSGRITNLRDDFGYIEDSGEKRAAISPVPGVIWRATKAGRDALKDRTDSFHTPSIATPDANSPQLSLEMSR